MMFYLSSTPLIQKKKKKKKYQYRFLKSPGRGKSLAYSYGGGGGDSNCQNASNIGIDVYICIIIGLFWIKLECY